MRLWSLVLGLAAACSTSLHGLTVTRGPFLQLGGDMAMLVVWQTDEPAESSVESGLTPELGQSDTDPGPKTDHALLLTDLSADTIYYYRVRGNGQPLSEVFSFKTSPAPSAEAPAYRFVAFGDSGGGTQAQLDVAARIAASEPEFGIHVGDLIYPADDRGSLDSRYFAVYRDTIARAPFYIALGNKEEDLDGGASALAAFHLPENSPSPERFYSFVHGNALFVALDSNRGLEAGGAQLSWLEETLAASDQTWKFVFLHHPIVTSGSGASAHRERLEPIFDAHRVDVVFQGHDHHYERSFPIAGGEVTGTGADPHLVDPPGRIYVVTGGGGGSLIPATPKPAAAFFRLTHHHLRLRVEDRLLTLEAIDGNGATFDTLTIRKTKPGSAPPFRRGDADDNGRLEITDAIGVLGFLFLGDAAPGCIEAADADDNGKLEVTDPILVLGFLFLGGDPPAPPGPPPGACGADPAGSPGLSCGEYASCG